MNGTHAGKGVVLPWGVENQPPASPAAAVAGVSPQARVSLEGLDYNPASGMNPLVWAAARLLDMVPQIRAMPRLNNPGVLRTQLSAEIRAFEQRAQAAGVPHQEVVGARYCLCTVLDEAAAQTPGGGRGEWAKRSLLVEFHKEAWGGEKYYQLLDKLELEPARYKNLIELLYYCNALGFQGRYGIKDSGRSELEMCKRRMASILAAARGGYEHRLSPHWQGVNSTPPVWRLVPPWVVAMLCALIGFGVFLWFLFSLGGPFNATSRKLAELKVPELVITRPVVRAPPKPETRCQALKRGIDDGSVAVTSAEPGRCVVTLKGDGLFRSASTEIRPPYDQVIGGIAAALRGMGDGAVRVLGYTDNQGISTARFPNNQALSQERAEVVKDLLNLHLGATSRISVAAVGRGDLEPVGDNRTPEGRAMNRRVELRVTFRDGAVRAQAHPSEVRR